MENFKRLFLQLFGDGDEQENTDVQEQEPKDDLEAESSQEENEEPEFENSEEGEPAEKEDKPQDEKSIKEQNRINAERRLQEKHRKELEAEKKKAYLDGLKFAVGNENPYTHEKIEDEFDLQVYKDMKEMEEKGLDPIEDYPKFVTQKHREEQKTLLEQEKIKEQESQKISQDIEAFDNKYGKGSAGKLLNDEKFINSKIATKLGKLSLEEVYELYTDTEARIKTEAENKAIQKQAISISATGKPGNTDANPNAFIDLINDDKAFKELQKNLLNKY